MFCGEVARAQASAGVISGFTIGELRNVAKVVDHLEGDESLSLEGINVLNPPPDVAFIAGGATASKIKVVRHKWTPDSGEMTRRDALRGLRLNAARKRKNSISPDGWLNVAFDFNDKVGSGRGPEILEDYMDVPRPSSIWISHKSSAFNENISAQLANGSFAHNPKREEKGGSLERPNNDGPDTNFENVLIRRSLLLIGSILGGFGLCFWGADRFDNKGPLVGAAPLIGACILACGEWASFGATFFESTWSWWL